MKNAMLPFIAYRNQETRLYLDKQG